MLQRLSLSALVETSCEIDEAYFEATQVPTGLRDVISVHDFDEL